jgi:hypothetical protein
MSAPQTALSASSSSGKKNVLENEFLFDAARETYFPPVFSNIQ